VAGLVEGKIAVVTGGGSGIGRAAAVAFAREGASVVVADVDVAGGEETAAMVGEAATFVACDVTSADDVQALVRRCVELHGRLDCAFNNAGIAGALAPTNELSEEDFDRTIAVNLKGVWLCMKHEIAQMLAQGGGGAIVNTSSGAGILGVPYTSAYTASKHGVVGLTRSVALEVVKQGIRVNAVCPGMVRTPMVADVPPDLLAVFEQTQPGGRIAEPEEVAEAAVWLCSDRASFVSGVPLPVDAASSAD
jgi:NAD(P)-dependent dehydrogenase (short-subunit alcohol dehydrogenase family)